MSGSVNVRPRATRPGDRIAQKYVVRRRIGEGGMGAVWLARNELTGGDVALKVLRPDGKADAVSDAVERFRYEARLGSMLRHRSITRVFDLIEEPDGTLVLVMELLRGETLLAHLRARETLPAREAIAIAVPILAALDHAHEMGIIHRDVKPANIYLSVEPDGQVVPKLLDFGIAKVQAANLHTLDGRVLGTPAYMSPEQIRATKEELTGRSDLFSMGVVLYEMLTGATPFDTGGAPSAALAAVLEAHVDPDPRIEPRLWIEIQRALAKRPNERHDSARVMAAALCAAIGETEEALAASIRRSRPPPPLDVEPLEETEVDAPSEPTAERAALSRSVSIRRQAPVTWLVGAGAAIAALLVLVTVAITRARIESHASGAGSAAAASVVAPLASAPAASVDTSAAVPSTAPERAAAPERTAAPRSARPASAPRKARPIATTPGF